MKKLRFTALLLSAAVLITGTTAGTDRILVRAAEPQELFWEEALQEETGEEQTAEAPQEKMAVVYLTDYYEVKEQPKVTAAAVVTVMSGQTVFVDECGLYEDEAWFRVHFSVGEEEYAGYIQEKNLAYSDERLILWKQEMLPEEPNVLTADGTMQLTEDIAQFPASYQQALMELKAAHPNWVFVKMNTGLSWGEVIYNEITPSNRSLVPSSSPSAWKQAYYGGGWYYASRAIVQYYMDPRNFLTEREIFQFEQLTYNASYHSAEAVQSFLNTTFMAGVPAGETKSYAQLFYEIGASLGVSPFHLASRVYQEQGQGTSPLISGVYPGYEGYYNYFNVGASGSTTTQVILSGLERAVQEGWNSIYASLYGGARMVSKNYILRGQDTLYLQKFDVDGGVYDGVNNGLYSHQYMQNICAPTSEGRSIYKLYQQNNAVDNCFVFKIPVYENMPFHACAIPAEYTDLEKTEWYFDYVSYAVKAGIMSGVSDNLFEPDAALTRAQLATILYNYAGCPQVTYTNVFADVPDGQWYTAPILWAWEQGIISGYGNGLFGTDDPVTREQMVQMVYQMGIYEGMYVGADEAVLNQFNDRNTLSDWAVPAMSWAVQVGIISGRDGGMFPKEGSSRAEAATVLYYFSAF